MMFCLPFPHVLVGKPSGFFPEDSFIDSGEIDVGRRASQKIPPGTFWRSQVFIDHPVHLKFNVSLGKAALVGIYGRKGLPPSHTQVTRTPHVRTLPVPRGIHLKSSLEVKKPRAHTWILELVGNVLCVVAHPSFALS